MREKLIDLLINNNIVPERKREIVRYGLTVAFLKIATFVVALGISFFLKTTLFLLVFLCFFVPLRRYGGGVHSKSSRRCFIYSESLLIIVQLAYKFFLFNRYIEAAFILLGLLSVAIWAPDESPNRPLLEKQKIKYRKYAISFGLSFAAFFVLSSIFEMRMLSVAVAEAFLLQAVLLFSSFCMKKMACSV